MTSDRRRIAGARKSKGDPQDGMKKSAKAPLRKRTGGTFVFLDENEFIRSLKCGIEFKLGDILERLADKIGGKVVRAFIYVSEKTELMHYRESKGLYASGRDEVRYIKTESLPGEVDRKMRDDIVLWSQTNAAGRIVIGTADGGPEFQAAIQSARDNGKEVVLLEAAGVFNSTLSKKVHGRINVTAHNPNRDEFEGLVTEIRLTRKADCRNPDVKFISAVAAQMISFFQREKEARFMKAVNEIWIRLASEWSIKGYSSDDTRVAIHALTHRGYALRWADRMVPCSDKPVKIYWLHEDSDVMRVLVQK